VQSNLSPMDCHDTAQLVIRNASHHLAKSRVTRQVHRWHSDMELREEDGRGGWTVLQRRGNFSRPNDYFFQDWASYKNGFGDIEKDFWIGNDNIFL
ncbi:hypothetical protein AVEN_32423-1, partial [Araneus ventricosus]